MQTLTVENLMEQGFYVRRGIAEALKLSDTERDVYSVIYSFTKNKEAGAYVGRQSYLAELTSRSEAAVSRALKSLIAKGYVTRISYTEHKERRTAYSADLELAARLIKQHVDAVNRAQAEEQSGENPPKLGIRGENDQAATAQINDPIVTAAKNQQAYSIPSAEASTAQNQQARANSDIRATGVNDTNKSCIAERTSPPPESGRGAYSSAAAYRRAYPDYPPRASSTRVDPAYANEALMLALERSYGE